MNPALQDQLNRLADADMPRGDLQGVVWVIARKFGVDDDLCLEYIDDLRARRRTLP